MLASEPVGGRFRATELPCFYYFTRNNLVKYHHGNQIRFFHYLVIMKTAGSLEKSTGLKITTSADGPLYEKVPKWSKDYYYIFMNW